MSRWGRFLCEECGDFLPDSMMSEEENICYGCFDDQSEESESWDDDDPLDDDDDDFDDPFA